MSNAKVVIGSSIPFNCGNDNNSELFIPHKGDHSNKRWISLIILQKNVFPDPFAPYKKDTLLNWLSPHEKTLSINSFLPESISVVNSILSANEAKFSTDKYLSIVLSIFFPPFRHYSIIFSSWCQQLFYFFLHRCQYFVFNSIFRYVCWYFYLFLPL